MGSCNGLSCCVKRAHKEGTLPLSASVILLLVSFYPTFYLWYSRERIEGPHSVLAATAAILAMQGASVMGNTYRRQTDSGVSAEVKGDDMHKNG